MSRRSVTEHTLNNAVEFDSPFRVYRLSNRMFTVIDDYLADVWAPDVVFTPGHTPDVTIECDPRWEWKPWMGASAQHGYSGPIMHPSEVLAGGMAREVLATPGIYCVIEVRDEDGTYPDDTPIGWALVFIED